MKNILQLPPFLILLTLAILLPLFGAAKVLRVEIDSRQTILQGESFGAYGAYEILKGRIYFGFDPKNEYNARITDLALAPRNAQGLVEAWGDLVVLQPVDQQRSSGVALVEVSNRGGKFSPSYFNRAAKSRELLPDDPDYWGDGLLMRQGLTVIWVGWQFDNPAGDHILHFNPPIATNTDGSAIYGLVRSDWTVDEPATVLGLGHRDQIGYPVANPAAAENVLTFRDGRDAPRLVIPREKWRFAEEKEALLVPSDANIYLEGGFQAGKIYELVYQAKDPPLVGLGLAAIRDVISYAKYDRESPFKTTKGIAAGVSQTGRFLRQFMYQGFNTDEAGRIAYDGMMIITAGAGRGSFNHRFAQPSRDAHRYSAFFYPTDLFPFTSRTTTDPLTGQSDGLLDHFLKKDHQPRIFYINTGYEYWGRAASLIHISPDGNKDVDPLPNERIYHLAGGQHFVDRFPPAPALPTGNLERYRGNPLEYKVNYRALLVRLVDWVKNNTAPPASRYPRIADKTLVEKEALQLPALSGWQKPTTIHQAYRADYGPRWSEGIIDRQPPQLGYAFPALVAQVDSLGNELGGIRNVELRAPLATYSSWSVRTDYPAGQQELVDFRGEYLPFPLTDAQKKETGDPRPSLEYLYPTRDDYFNRVKKEASTLAAEGFLLKEDIAYVTERAQLYWDWRHNQSNVAPSHGPEKGSLLIIGGGRLDDVFYEKFMELAGGPDAPIVVIPTASGADYLAQEGSSAKFKTDFEQKGFKNVTILHTTDPKEADTEAFVAPIEKAQGVWFTGGRQWRLADSYLHNRTHKALKALLDREGVIAGSSAGATIQGSYLARGDTKGNTLMMGDHEEGMGFVTNVAIDQHLLTRNRQFDLYEILEHRPELLGIGLDENTGILVQGNQFEVLGKSYVAIYDGKKYAPERAAYFLTGDKFYFLKHGQKYDLVKRRVID